MMVFPRDIFLYRECDHGDLLSSEVLKLFVTELQIYVKSNVTAVSVVKIESRH